MDTPLIRAAQIEYDKIENTMSPAIENSLVRFNAIGFRHLIRKARMRSRAEQISRFNLIKYAPIIVGDPRVAVTYRQDIRIDGRIVRYWALHKKIDGKRLSVIVRQVGNGEKHFYSIMERKPKHATKNPA